MIYTSCLIGFLIIFLYCIFATIKNKEIPNSISQIIYSLSDNWKWTFTVVMFLVSFMIAPQLVEVMPNGYEFLGILTAGGILGVGVDPLDKDRTNVIHYTSAIVMGIASQVAVYMIYPHILLFWIGYIVYTLFMEDGSKNMFIGELIMLLTTALICLLG